MMRQDLRFTLRLLNHHRAYAVLAVLTIALGVGVNTAVFSVADAVLFRPLPFPDSNRLFVLRIGNPQTDEVYGSLPGPAVDTALGTNLFDGAGIAPSRGARAYVRQPGGLDTLALAPVSREFLQLLGVRPVLGRIFDASDVGTRAVLLSHRTWMRRHGGDPAIVGALIPSILRTMDANTQNDPPLRVVGILPPRLRLPLASGDDGVILLEGTLGGAGRAFPPLVRLRPGISAAAAQAQLAALEGPELVPDKSVLRLVPLREELAGRQDPLLWLLLSAAATVLLVGCVNLANLVLARGSLRTRELAIRAALGSSRLRLVRLLLLECAGLSLLGTALGIAAAYWGFQLLSAQLPPALAAVADPAFDLRTLAFAITAATMAAIGFSLVPAIRLSRADSRSGLQHGRLQVSAGWRGRTLLVCVEVATCVALLAFAGLVGRSLLSLLSQDLGFESRRIVAAFDLPTLVVERGGTLRADVRARAAFVRSRLVDVRTAPGVRAAGAASAPPFSTVAPDAPLMEGQGSQQGGVYSVSSGFFDAIGARIIAGRDLTDAESFSAAPVGVLNESAARVLCGGAIEHCIGLTVRSPEQPARTIVGIVGDLRPALQRTAMAAMYVPFNPERFVFGWIVIDSLDTPASRDALQRLLASSPDVRVEIRSLEEARDRELSPFRFNVMIVGAFAWLTLMLAVVGVFGVMSAMVGERRREYGIRLALGATRARVSRDALRHAFLPIGVGIAVGLVVAGWLSRFVASLLYGVVPLDIASFAVAALVVLASALAAAFAPASRAGRVDPIVALRAE